MNKLNLYLAPQWEQLPYCILSKKQIVRLPKQITNAKGVSWAEKRFVELRLDVRALAPAGPLFAQPLSFLLMKYPRHR